MLLQPVKNTQFVHRLHARADRVGHVLCVGIDPFEDKIPALFGPRGALSTLEAFALEVLDLVGPQACAIKPQLGLFEPWGAAGIGVLERVCAQAQAAGIPVILDAKRGDIGTTAQGYARALLGPDPALAGDCVTVNPYMGLDTLEPFEAAAHATGKSVAVLVRTSNPGARDFQGLDCGGVPLWQKIAQALVPMEQRLLPRADAAPNAPDHGPEPFSSLMIVAGATAPAEARLLRSILPQTLFLVPGYGAQGASALDAMAGLSVLGGKVRGGLINASRSVLYPAQAAQASSLAHWRTAMLDNLQAVLADLQAAEKLRVAQG